MGVFEALGNATLGTLADQWGDIIIPGAFNEQTAVAPGVLKVRDKNGRGSNYKGTENVLSNGSVVYVPENTAAFVLDQGRIENVLVNAGGYEYNEGQASIFGGDGAINSFFKQTAERVRYGGITPDQKLVGYINMREIRGIKFGTRGPVIYNDKFYGTDLEVYSYGSFSVRVVAPFLFLKNFVPANTISYTFADKRTRSQLLSDFLQSYISALNALSEEYRISQLPSQATALAEAVKKDEKGAGTWPERFGFEVVAVGIESIELSEASRELVHTYSSNRMHVAAYENVSRTASDIAAQQHIARGIEENGLGDGGGMLFGMNLAQGLNSSARGPATDHVTVGVASGGDADEDEDEDEKLSIDEQISALKSLKELLDAGILTQDEFDLKKKEILGL